MIRPAEILAATLGAKRSGRLLAQDVISLALIIVIGTALGYGIAHGSWKIPGSVLASLLVLHWPVETAVGIFLFLVPFDSINVIGTNREGTPLTWFLGAAGTVVLLATGLVQRRWQRPPHAALWWSLMILWAATTYLWAVEPSRVAERLPTAFSLLSLFVAAVSLRINSRELMSVILLAIAGGVAAALLSASEFFSSVASGPRASLIMNDISTNPNVFAASLLLPLALAVGQVLSTQRRIERSLMLGAIATIAFSVFLTMSRGSLVAVGVMLLVFLLRMGVKARLIAPIAVVFASLEFMPEQFFYRLHTAVASGGAGRFGIWTAGLAALQRYGLFGGGLDNFPVVYNEFAGHARRYEGFARDPHNIYIGFWVEAGIVGLLLFLVAVRSHLGDVGRLRRHFGGTVSPQIIAMEAACWSILAASFFETMLWRKAFWAVWMLTAMTVTVQLDSRSAFFEGKRDAILFRTLLPWRSPGAAPSRTGTTK